MALPDALHVLAQPYGPDDVPIHPVAVETADGVALLDVGVPANLDDLADGLAEAGLALDDVEWVVLTHHDYDHTGALASVVDRTDADVFAHVDETTYVEGDSNLLKGSNDVYEPVPVDVGVTDGVRFRTAAGPMVVVETPGHTPGHVSLYFSDERFLVAGDALTADTALLGPSEEFTIDMDRAVDSVRRLADLDVDRTLCYHGGLVEAGSDRIAEIFEDASTS